jgi:hypothetical protein
MSLGEMVGLVIQEAHKKAVIGFPIGIRMFHFKLLILVYHMTRQKRREKER